MSVCASSFKSSLCKRKSLKVKNSYFVQLGDNRMFYVIFLGFPLSYLLTELITMFYTEDLSNWHSCHNLDVLFWAKVANGLFRFSVKRFFKVTNELITFQNRATAFAPRNRMHYIYRIYLSLRKQWKVVCVSLKKISTLKWITCLFWLLNANNKHTV